MVEGLNYTLIAQNATVKQQLEDAFRITFVVPPITLEMVTVVIKPHGSIVVEGIITLPQTLSSQVVALATQASAASTNIAAALVSVATSFPAVETLLDTGYNVSNIAVDPTSVVVESIVPTMAPTTAQPTTAAATTGASAPQEGSTSGARGLHGGRLRLLLVAALPGAALLAVARPS